MISTYEGLRILYNKQIIICKNLLKLFEKFPFPSDTADNTVYETDMD